MGQARLLAFVFIFVVSFQTGFQLGDIFQFIKLDINLMNFIISVFIHFLVNKSFQAKMFQRNRSSLWLLPGSTLTCVVIMTIVWRSLITMIMACEWWLQMMKMKTRWWTCSHCPVLPLGPTARILGRINCKGSSFTFFWPSWSWWVMTMIMVMVVVVTCICQAQELSNILLLLSSPPSCLVAIKIMMVTIVTIHDEWWWW